MTVCRQLLVRHRGLDPTTWTALHALRALHPQAAPTALARAVVWEFTWQEGGDLAARLAQWVGAANWFANPNRDRLTWRGAAADPTDLEAGAALVSGGVGSAGPGACLITAWRGAGAGPAHSAAAARALGHPVQVRRGELWWLSSDGGDAVAILRAAGAEPAGGLLANPHSEVARVLVGAVPVPLLPDDFAGGAAEGPPGGNG
jgi:hypothetical protein